MLPIGGKPIVWHHEELCPPWDPRLRPVPRYKGWVVKEFFLNYLAMTTNVTVTLGRALEFLGSPDEEDWRVTLAETCEETMTGGRVAAVRRYVEKEETFFLTYGDGVAGVDLTSGRTRSRSSSASRSRTSRGTASSSRSRTRGSGNRWTPRASSSC